MQIFGRLRKRKVETFEWAPDCDVRNIKRRMLLNLLWLKVWERIFKLCFTLKNLCVSFPAKSHLKLLTAGSSLLLLLQDRNHASRNVTPVTPPACLLLLRLWGEGKQSHPEETSQWMGWGGRKALLGGGGVPIPITEIYSRIAILPIFFLHPHILPTAVKINKNKPTKRHRIRSSDQDVVVKDPCRETYTYEVTSGFK